MELSGIKIEDVSLAYIKKLQSVEGDLELARRVVMNDMDAVNYFIGEFSNAFLDYIGAEIMKREGIYIDGALHYYPSIYGEYYEFVGAKFIGKKPEWHKVSLYKATKTKGDKDARLYTYINTITVRYFISLKQKEDRNKEKYNSEMLENQRIAILKEYNGFDEITLGESEDYEETELEWAWKRLPKREQLILKYLVIEERNTLDIFDEMIQYVETVIPPEQYSKKQRQDAMSLLKGRAKKHLRELIILFRNNRKYETPY